jgi:D-serine deaminase-like pyridoxal phosphate-dependent protein
MRVAEVDTPALLLDLDRAERNLDAMAARFAGTHVALRPHAKTHKSPQIARMQLDRGAIGLCCATLGEAEFLAAGGIADLLITSELAGEAKIRRLLALAVRVRPLIVVDDPHVAAAISSAAVAQGLRVDTLVDVDVGQHRTGVAPGDPAVTLAKHVAAQPGLRLRGLQGYEGHLQHVEALAERRTAHAGAMAQLASTAAAFRAAGLSAEIVTTGGTGTSAFAAAYPAITDVQAGSYVMMDAQYGAVHGVAFEQALTVLATVTSVRSEWAVVDAGYKALSIDGVAPRPLTGDARFAIAGDEHGKLFFGADPPPQPGTTIQFIPGHCDTTINLFSEYVVHRNGDVVATWPLPQ